MTREQVFNFAAGPSVLPEEVLKRAGAEILNYDGSGMSVMEMSHRSKVYQGIFDATYAKLKAALSVPDTHDIMFLQGGASTQFAMVPLNLMGKTGKADYAITGNFANGAAKEARKYGTVQVAASSEDKNHTYIPQQQALKLDPEASYFYYCANNTIYGTEWNYVPEVTVPLVCDMSSNILSKPIDVSKYGIIFAGAQKNMAPAGLTVVMMQKDLMGQQMPMTPAMLTYKLMSDKGSMYNTPPCWNIYMLGLVLDWLKEQGGVAAMQQINQAKAAMLYDFLDESKLFHGCAEPEARSNMNVTFRTGDEAIDAAFVKAATEHGFVNIKGHRFVGGMRASIYNAMPVEGVKALVAFMKDFEVRANV